QDVFIAQITNPTNAVCIGSDCVSRGHIVDDDGPPSISVAPVAVREPLSGSKLVAFTATTSPPHPGFEGPVNWSTRDGTAVARPGSCGLIVIGGGGTPDYFSGSGTLIFAPGVQTQTFNVTICFDHIEEPTETFVIHQSGAVNATAGGDATGSI